MSGCNSVVALRVPKRALKLLMLSAVVIVAVLSALVPPEDTLPGCPYGPHTPDRLSWVWQPSLDPMPGVPLEATAYCACPICCGSWADGRTATGTWATEGRTMAADPFFFAAGTCLALEGLGHRIVEDTGSAILDLHIDIFFRSHQDALEFGRQFVTWGKC